MADLTLCCASSESQVTHACCAMHTVLLQEAGRTHAVLCMLCCAFYAVLGVHAVLCMLCSLTRTSKTDLHLRVARLEQRGKQHQVIILAPHHIPLLIVIKNNLQQSNVT